MIRFTTEGEEHWLPIAGYEGYYEVSDQGRVRSLDRQVRSRWPGKTQTVRGSLMSPRVQEDGHVKAALSMGAVKRTPYVHTLVLEAFVGPRPHGLEACHNNGDPTDNRVENLRWDTHSANMLDKVTHGTHPQSLQTHCPKGHEYTEENTYRNSGRRHCKECSRIKSRDYQRRKKALRQKAMSV